MRFFASVRRHIPKSFPNNPWHGLILLEVELEELEEDVEEETAEEEELELDEVTDDV